MTNNPFARRVCSSSTSPPSSVCHVYLSLPLLTVILHCLHNIRGVFSRCCSPVPLHIRSAVSVQPRSCCLQGSINTLAFYFIRWVRRLPRPNGNQQVPEPVQYNPEDVASTGQARAMIDAAMDRTVQRLGLDSTKVGAIFPPLRNQPRARAESIGLRNSIPSRNGDNKHGLRNRTKPLKNPGPRFSDELITFHDCW